MPEPTPARAPSASATTTQRAWGCPITPGAPIRVRPSRSPRAWRRSTGTSGRRRLGAGQCEVVGKSHPAPSLSNTLTANWCPVSVGPMKGATLDLVIRAKARDREAFEMLVERHAPETYRLAADDRRGWRCRDVTQERRRRVAAAAEAARCGRLCVVAAADLRQPIAELAADSRPGPSCGPGSRRGGGRRGPPARLPRRCRGSGHPRAGVREPVHRPSSGARAALLDRPLDLRGRRRARHPGGDGEVAAERRPRGPAS